MQPQGLGQWKIPMTPSGIEPATFRFVEQRIKFCYSIIKVASLITALFFFFLSLFVSIFLSAGYKMEGHYFI